MISEGFVTDLEMELIQLKSFMVLATVVVQHVFTVLVSQKVTEVELVRGKQCSLPFPSP